ncbi:ribose-phosphate pyrophosphokinase [Fusobacterium vincentii]|uniref:hypothetical protein n=1 Tax=Fusobacterium TaxID=848 RepID=UPI0003B89E5B|nr:hypothetical protein [Fusobacterium nucleatum]ERT44460.1 hypothetical protein HMPREF1768_01929 [Fusobacterium nucleatum CTI-7]
MAKYTEHLRLVKPEGNEYYNVEQFNQNAELIDKETKKLSEGLAKVQEGATREKAGIVQFGTEEGKALEGMMLARLAGCVGYGGDIQEPGVKDVNYIYYDRNTRKMYKCLNQNSDVSANVANFIPLDNNSLLDRLENFYTYREFNNYAQIKDVTSITARVYTVGNLAITSIIVETPKLIGKTTIKFPIKYKALPFVTFQDNDTASTPPGPLGINWTNLDSIEVQGFNGGFTMLVVGAI